MKKLISRILVCMGALMVLAACGKTAKDENSKNNPSVLEQTDGENASSSNAKLTIITQHVDQYPSDAGVLSNEEVIKRLTAITGDDYDEIINNFDTETPIVTAKGVYKFTGCKAHDCPAYQITVLYDEKTDNLNVLVDKKGRIKVYDEKGKITISNALEAK